MSTPIIAQLDSQDKTLTIQLGHEYEVAQDAGVWHNGRLLTGVYLDQDGEAWAGRIADDGTGPFVSLIEDEDGMIPAHNEWDRCIIREIPALILAPVDQPLAA